MRHSIPFCTVVTLIALAAGRIEGGPPLREEGESRVKFTADLKAALAAEGTATGKAAALSRAYKAESHSDVRRVVFEHISTPPDAAIDRFLADVLSDDADAGIRSLAATALGTHGTDQCLPTLAKAAATDKVTECRVGCIVGTGTARRAATFAIAALAARHPKLAGRAATTLRELTPPADPKDAESLADARVQALYQVTHDEKLLTPFLERLRSTDAKVRENGVVAFRFFQLKVAPPELVAALGDADADVRSWAGLALGEIADPKTVPVLMAVAGDAKKDAGLRCNVIGSLGRMKATTATDLMRQLLADENAAVQVQAAISLYRLTGEKVKQFPAGYNAN
ncbi:HEAT repeat domain-containing protein [Limnoglobus roseus]|uniref:HEAT repeat domain-containing protein n=1 Tax=Limnoglobus roseus TaxID=2598579 RepID=A0A5C1AJR5_9BACT|nr:HEAT repeat domain-containing protein [Limnoglobus roseus]QEL17942.1 HEAT repeat domain-containing protein [Limnoglobus roseus]